MRWVSVCGADIVCTRLSFLHDLPDGASIKGKATLAESHDSAQRSGPPSLHPGAFIALSRFTVANGMADQVKDAFVNRPHLVDDAPGFIRMEVISPCDDPREIWLFTYW